MNRSSRQAGLAAVQEAPPREVANENSFAPDASAQMERMVADFGRMYRERNEALEEVSRAHHEALLRLALAADFKDDETGVHIVRIGYLAEALALLLGKSASWTALAMLRDQRGKAFDPRIVDTFLESAPQLIALRDEVNLKRPSFDSLVDSHAPGRGRT